MAYDDDGCDDGDFLLNWFEFEPLKIKVGAFKLTNKYRNDIESLVVQKGCTLKVYTDNNYTWGEYIFKAPSDSDLIIRELEDDLKTKYLDDNIESLVCTCNIASIDQPKRLN